jgi:hypothetical protein
LPKKHQTLAKKTPRLAEDKKSGTSRYYLPTTMNELIQGRTNRESREKSQRIVAQGYSHAYNPRIQQNRL